jgi:hypothetical protein
VIRSRPRAFCGVVWDYRRARSGSTTTPPANWLQGTTHHGACSSTSTVVILPVGNHAAGERVFRITATKGPFSRPFLHPR